MKLSLVLTTLAVTLGGVRANAFDFDVDLMGDVASGDASPSAPPTPPTPPPPVQGTVYSVVSFEASGDVSDIDEAKKESIASAFAALVGVDASKVAIDVSSGSVVITAYIEANSTVAANSANDKLRTTLDTPSATTTFLTNHGVSGVNATQAPSISLAVANPPPPSPSTGNKGLSGGAIASIVVPITLLFIACTTLAYIKLNAENRGEKLMKSLKVDSDLQLEYSGQELGGSQVTTNAAAV